MNNSTSERIHALKNGKNAIILAHNYQPPEIQDIADFNGDSLELARRCLNVQEDTIVFCGVSFMAETAKILNPARTVLLPVEDAGCRMADMARGETLAAYKEKNPGTKIVCYINSTAEIKALSDVCVTSSNAVSVVQSLNARRILFLPDKNLGAWVAAHLPDTEVDLWPGYCYVHNQITADDIETARREHPDAEVIVHPECPPDITHLADEVLSTGQMRTYVKDASATEFIIGTEEGMLHRLRSDNPGKEFFPARQSSICDDMKKITLESVEESLRKSQYPVTVQDNVALNAKRAIDRMLELS